MIIVFQVIAFSQSEKSQVEKIIEEQSLKDLESPYAQSRAIYDWITSNISYDINKRFTLSTSRDSFIELAERTALERKAVCLGYAALFKKICDHLNIPAFVAKGKAYIPREDEMANHAWVIFKTEKGWHLADPTWGAGYVSGYVFAFQKSWEFFDPSPDEFIKTHYPFEPAFQLLRFPLTYQEFAERENERSKGDSLLNYQEILSEKLTSSDPIDELQRALKYKKDDPFLMHDLATYYQEEASKLARDCVNEYNRLGRFSNTSDCPENIRTAENYLERSVDLFQKIIKMDAPQKQMAWLNLASAKNNLKTIQILKQY